VVDVKAGGELRAVGVGSATVTMIAHNGNSKRVKVAVVDASLPAKFDWHGWTVYLREVFESQKDDVTGLVHYLIHNPLAATDREGGYSLGDYGNLVTTGNVQVAGVRELVTRILRECPYDLSISVSDGDGFIRFGLVEPSVPGQAGGFESISFSYFESEAPPSEGKKGLYNGIAPHWTLYRQSGSE
jgi:hypothetical protein